MDEEDSMRWILNNEQYECVADLCIGRGLVAGAAYQAGKRFVGTELNCKKLSLLLSRLNKMGAEYHIEEK